MVVMFACKWNGGTVQQNGKDDALGQVQFQLGYQPHLGISVGPKFHELEVAHSIDKKKSPISILLF